MTLSRPRLRAGSYWGSLAVALLLFACAGWCFYGAPSGGALKELDKQAGIYYSSTIKQAAGAYATTAVINGVISVVKDSDVEATPMGIGMSLSYGQILDPIDDAVEQLSSLLGYIIVGLTALRALHWILTSVGMGWIGWLLVIAGVLSLFPRIELGGGQISAAVHRVKNWVLRVAFLLLGARLMLPAAALISEDLDEKFFQPKFEAAMAPLRELEKMEEEAQARRPPTLSVGGEDVGWTEYPVLLYQRLIVEPWNYLKFKMTRMYRMLDTVWTRRGEFVQGLTDTLTLYATSFFINVILLPILLLLGFNQLVNTLFDLNNSAPALAQAIAPPSFSKKNTGGGGEGEPSESTESDARVEAVKAEATST